MFRTIQNQRPRFDTTFLRAVDEALQDVCAQIDRNITLCVWHSASSWGLQVADYGLWATQRVLEGRTCSWFAQCIEPTLESVFTPWGRAH